MSSEENKIVPVSEENQKKPNIEVVESKDELRPICRIKPKMPNEFKSETENKRISLNKNDKEALSICLPKLSRTFQFGRTVLNKGSSKQCAEQEHPIEEQRIKKIVQERLKTQVIEDKRANENDDYDNDDVA